MLGQLCWRPMSIAPNHLCQLSQQDLHCQLVDRNVYVLAGLGLIARNPRGRTFTVDPDEIQAAYLLRDKVPPAKPTPNDVLRQSACPGGFLVRKNTANPASRRSGLA